MVHDINYLRELISQNKLEFEHSGLITGRPFYKYKHLTVFYSTSKNDEKDICIQDGRKSGVHGNSILTGGEPYRIFMEYHNSPRQKLKRLLDETTTKGI